MSLEDYHSPSRPEIPARRVRLVLPLLEKVFLALETQPPKLEDVTLSEINRKTIELADEEEVANVLQHIYKELMHYSSDEKRKESIGSNQMLRLWLKRAKSFEV